MAKVLVIDDEPSVRETLVRQLGALGHEAIALDDAYPLLESSDYDSVDVIVTDLAMPTSGEDMIHAVRGRGCRTPIVVLSGSLRPEDAERLAGAGADRVLAKPPRLTGLLAAIEEVLA